MWAGFLISHLADSSIRSDNDRVGRQTATKHSWLFSRCCWIHSRHTPPQWLCWVPLTTRTQRDVGKPVYGTLARCYTHVSAVLSVFHHGWFNLCVLTAQCSTVMLPHPSTRLFRLTKMRRGEAAQTMSSTTHPPRNKRCHENGFACEGHTLRYYC
jgi:hypothetical protein